MNENSLEQETTINMQFTIISVLSLLALTSALPQGVPPPIERCTKADIGKSCNAGEINGFYVTGTCSSTAVIFRPDESQYFCIPLGTLVGQPLEPSS
ncbi:hypothetical protein VTL71DRAFT_4990 [Oculimacula yallundae]|uniref:Uncharacterized protein n=1 Tax=Oculimacula yallundae TaxID=86028 RepID=A0ABR4C3I8_9HELO